MTGYFESGVSICSSCNLTCSECINNSQTLAVSCVNCSDPNRNLDSNGFCKCKNGTYEDINGLC